MNTSVLTSKNRISLPNEIVEAANLHLHDEIFWTVDGPGELRGRKLEKAALRPGRIATDPKSGLLFWDSNISDAEAEEAALNANVSRHD